MTTDPTITIAGLRATIEREYYREQARTMAGEIVELQAERRGHAAERQSLTAERDALAAQLAEVRATADRQVSMRAELDRVSADRVRIDCERADAVSELARTCRDLASERAHLAACRTRIAGLEQAANERRAEVARLTARVAELEARPVLTVEAAVAAAKSTGWSSSACRDAETVVGSILAALGPVTLPPAQDRADELARAIDRAAEEGSTIWSDATRRDRADITRAALASLGAPPTSPPAARPVFAGVSVDDLREERLRAVKACNHSDDSGLGECCGRAGIRAVLARLEVSLVAPVDPEAVARAYHDHKDAPAPEWDEVDIWRGRDADEQTHAIAAMRTTLTARGIPVTPEVGK